MEITNINIDSKSGVTGAGRKLKNDYLFCSVNENFFAYSPLMHRHTGEIEQELSSISGKNIKVCFTPHLLPVNRGIFTSIYCNVEICTGGNKEGNLQVNPDIGSMSGPDAGREINVKMAIIRAIINSLKKRYFAFIILFTVMLLLSVFWVRKYPS